MRDFDFTVGDKVATRPHDQTGFVLVTAVGEDQFLGRYLGSGTEASYMGTSWYRYVEPAPKAPKATVTFELEHREPKVGEQFYCNTPDPGISPLDRTLCRRDHGEFLSVGGRWVVVGTSHKAPTNVRW